MWNIVGLALFTLGFANAQTTNLPVSVAYFPLNGTYGLEELCNRAPKGEVSSSGNVNLALGLDGRSQGSHELNGGGSIVFPNGPAGTWDLRYSIAILFWVFPNGSKTLYPLLRYYNATTGVRGPFIGRSLTRFEGTIVSRDGSLTVGAGGGLDDLPPGVWSHVGLTYDNETGVLNLFVNGSVIGTTTILINELATQYPVVVGSEDVPGFFYSGRITQIAVFDESLSQENVSAIYSGASQVTCECNPANQFTCDNGLCIDVDARCDGIADCRDRSDEQGCILSLDGDPSVIVDCGNNGTGITITIVNIRDVSQWLRDQDQWRLNSNADCPVTFGVSNATYGPFDANNCASPVSNSLDFVYTFLIKASKQGSAAVLALNHCYRITCGYGRNGMVFSSFETIHEIQASDTNSNSLGFALKLYSDVSYAEEFIIGSTPIRLGSVIYARVYVLHDFQSAVDLLLEKCFISTDSAGRENKYDLIENSCDIAENDFIVDYNCSGQASETEDFILRAVRFVGSDNVWIHCSVYACLSDNSSSVCQTLCDGCSKRKRRDTGRFSDTSRYKVSSGPYRFLGNQEEEQKDNTSEEPEEQEDQAAPADKKLIIIVGGSCVVATVIVCATVIIVLRKRRSDIAATKKPVSKNVFENQGCEGRDIAGT